MKDLGIKVVGLNSRVCKLEKILNLRPICFQPRFSSGYDNLLVNKVADLNTRVVRLERYICTGAGNRGKSAVMLKNIAMNINNLCQRIVKLENNIDIESLSLSGTYSKGDLYKTFINCEQDFFKVAGSTSMDSGLSVSAIVNGTDDSVYVTGYIDTSAGPKDFKGSNVMNLGGTSGESIFVAKLKSDGEQVFFKVAGSTSTDQGLSISTIVNGTDDSVYVTGYINTSASPTDFDGGNVMNLGGTSGESIFVAKLKSNGEQVFFKVAGSTSIDSGRSVSAIVNSIDDSVYVTGIINTTSGPKDFKGGNVTGYGEEDIFVAKLKSNGDQVFFRVAGSTSTDQGSSVSAIVNGTDDSVYVTGFIDTSSGNDPKSFDGSNVTGYGSIDIFVAKLKSNGDQVFFKVAGSTSIETGLSVSAIVNGTDDSVYVTGYINTSSGTKDFKGGNVSGYGSIDIFVAKLKSNGEQVFFKVAGSTSTDSGRSVSAFVNGTDDSIYVTGSINTSLSPKDFKGDNVTGYGGIDIFVAKLKSNGEQVFFRVAGSTASFEEGLSVSAIVNGTDDSVYVTGYINTSAGPKNFDGAAVMNPGGTSNYSIFVAKISCNYDPQGIVIQNTTNGITKILPDGGCIGGSIFGLKKNTCYYWNGAKNKITVQPTSLFLGCTDNNNKLLLNMIKI